MKNKVLITLGMGAVFGSCAANAQVTLDSITALSGFGTGGWLAPGSSTYVTSGTTERGLTYADGDLFMTSRASGNTIQIFSPTTGANLGSLNTTGVTGGTFAIDGIAAGSDGNVYVGNLTTSATSPFIIYKYTPAAISGGLAPTVAYSGNPVIGTRLGDDLAAIGSGSSTLLVAGAGAGSSGYAVINPTAGTAVGVGFTGSPPAVGDFRLGVTFLNSSTVMGTQGSAVARLSTFSGTTGTLVSSPTLSGTADRPIAYFTTPDGQQLLASISTGDNHVTLYDASNPSALINLGSVICTTGTLPANSNGTGAITFGPVTSDGTTDTGTIYALSTADGISAVQYTIAAVPEPSTLALGAIGVVSGLLWRRRR